MAPSEILRQRRGRTGGLRRHTFLGECFQGQADVAHAAQPFARILAQATFHDSNETR